MSYKAFCQEDLAFLHSIIPEKDRVLSGKDIQEEYSHDELSGTCLLYTSRCV